MMLGRSVSRDNIFHMKRLNASEKTLNEQMTLEKNLTLFNKKMNALKSQSIFKNEKMTFSEFSNGSRM